MKKKFLFAILVLVTFLLTASMACSPGTENQPRGKYIYDEIDRLPLESELALSSYLWRFDEKTNYEIVVVFPKEKLDEESIINWFNDHGVGKKEKDTGAAIFVFPDNLVFVAIGSGNDLVSVAASKTYGEEILKDLDKDPVLSLLRFVNVFSDKITEPVTSERDGGFGNTMKEIYPLIFLWALVGSLIFFLIQQINGFQKTDLILPIVVLALTGMVVGFSLIGGDTKDRISNEFGVITSTELSTYEWVEIITTTDSEGNTHTIVINHTDYRNDVTILSYDFKPYNYRFVTTDHRSAWDHKTGEVDALEVNRKSGELGSVYRVKDNSGGKTIGDGVWINRK